MNDNIVSLVPDPKSSVPENDYVITDIHGSEVYGTGFLLFTSHHIAVMRETPEGALPVLVMPLNMVYSAELVEDDELEDAPF